MSQNPIFFDTIFQLALQSDKEAITNALKEIRELKINFIREKIPDFVINFKFENEQICKDMLENLGINPSERYYDINVENLIPFEDFELLNYYLKQEIKTDFMTAHFAVV